MKITKFFASIFILTFLLGYISTLFVKLRQIETTYSSVHKMESAKTADINFKSDTLIQQNEINSKPKIFNVEGFWDELENQQNKHLIETGEISNGKDFKVKSGETWFGLFGGNERSYLRQTRIRVQRTDQSDLSWKEISVKGKEKPLFLVKNLKKLKEGKIKTIFRGSTWQETDEGEKELTSLGKGFSRNFNLGEKRYTLRVEEGISERQEPILVLLLETGSESQIVHYIGYSSEGDYVGNLFWVGDLDSDGKLDLFMDFWNYEKGSYSSGLFLSSEAKKGKLVKEFGYFGLAGC
ncbi:MAG: hypothetical protein M3Q99_11960 [Acidobacteriota bacterium]|nr:hypothetical protein [Acidobacteriota bacterium]